MIYSYSIAGKWSEFALKIGIDEDLEDEIYTNNEACLQETLEYFFKRRAPFKEITAALCHIEEHKLACSYFIKRNIPKYQNWCS